MIGYGPSHRLPFDLSGKSFAGESLEFHQVRNGPDNDLSIPGFNEDAIMKLDPGFPTGGDRERDLPFRRHRCYSHQRILYFIK
jgi:hypothetical protein